MVDYSNIPRDSRRVPLETRVQFKFDRFSGFISEYSSNISPGGMFIRTFTPEPAGRILDFEFRLGDGFELIKGRGEVVWNRDRDEGPARPAGMGIRFLELSQESKDLIYRIVDTYVQEGGIPFDVSLVPPDPIPSGAPPRAAAPVSSPPAGLPAFSRDLPPEFAVEDEEPFQLDPLPAAPPPDLDMSGGPPPLETPDFPRAAFSPGGYEPPPTGWEPELPLASPAPPPFYLPEPSAPRDEPTPLTNYAGSASAPQARSRTSPWLLAGLGLVVLVAALFLLRDRLLDWAGLGDEPTIAQATPAPRPRRAPQRQPAPAATPAPAEPAPTPVLIEEEAPPAETPAPGPAPEPAAETAGPAARALERITFEAVPGGGTRVLLHGDGSWPAGRWTRVSIEGNPPREVIKLSGIERPYPTTRLVAGTPELLQVRTGYHAGQELHVVLDLSNPRVQIAEVQPVGDQLRVLLRTRN